MKQQFQLTLTIDIGSDAGEGAMHKLLEEIADMASASLRERGIQWQRRSYHVRLIKCPWEGCERPLDCDGLKHMTLVANRIA